MAATPILPFFVYGTLLPGQPNAGKWQGLATPAGIVTLPDARLHDLGAFPMLVDAPGENVRGVLLEPLPRAYTRLTRRLDALERYDSRRPDEGLYRRRARDVVLPGGVTRQAWVYVGQAAVAAQRPIVPGGDWAAYSAAWQARLADWWAAHEADYDRARDLHAAPFDRESRTPPAGSN